MSKNTGEKKLEAHLFICTHLRESGDCCGKKGSAGLRDQLKASCKDPVRGWKGRVRINAAGCLGRCEEGITAVLYPEGRWFTELTTESAPELESALAETLDPDGHGTGRPGN